LRVEFRNLGQSCLVPNCQSVAAELGKVGEHLEQFAEGAVVTILALEDRETFTLGPEAEAALLEAIGEADRGELLSEEELWRELRKD